MYQGFECFYRADIGEETEFLAHGEEALLGTHFCCRIVVETGVAYCREKYCVAVPAYFKSLLRERVADSIDCGGADQSLFEFNIVPEFAGSRFHHLHTLYGDFRADSVKEMVNLFEAAKEHEILIKAQTEINNSLKQQTLNQEKINKQLQYANVLNIANLFLQAGTQAAVDANTRAVMDNTDVAKNIYNRMY